MNRIGSLIAFFAGAAALADTGFADSMRTESSPTAHNFSFETPEGDPLPLEQFKGRTILIVNTATACGFSDQIGGLQKLHETYSDRGLVVLGIPSNDFGGQEPRKNSEIAGYCEGKYGARFLMSAKTSVKGSSAHPFYKWATDELGMVARPFWNFHKYLVRPDGTLEAWYSTPTRPTSGKITTRIESLLAQVPAD
ncbi:MAG: glutathione peroxidase [Roseibium sp.]